MATRYWLGTTGELDATANWSDTTLPVDGDTIVFDGRTTTGPSTDMSGLADVDAAAIKIMPSATYNIGTAAAPFTLECSGTLQMSGTGTMYFRCGNTTAADTDVANLVQTNGTLYLFSEKNANGGNVSLYTTITITNGTFTAYGETNKGSVAASGTAIGTLNIVPTRNKDSAVTVTIGDNCRNIKTGTAMTINMSAGNVTTYSEIATLTKFGGTLTIGGSGYTMDDNDDDITTITQYGGTIYWKPANSATASASPTIGTLTLYGGTFDASDMKATLTTAPTITTLTCYDSSKIDLDNGYGNFVVTTFKSYGYDAIETTDGQALTIS